MTLLVFVVAVAISAVAAYYSIIGLITIFAAAALPVAIMGTVLEVGKLVTATWLYRNWKEISWWLKTYLTSAVVVLMLITSMGIFGFLSKAHIEQTASADQNLATIERIEDELVQKELRIQELQEAGVVNNEKQNEQIDNNKKQIEDINTRYLELIEEVKSQNPLILLDKYIADGDTRAVQSLVGVNPDGSWGSRTSQAVDAFRERNQSRVDEINTRVQELRNAQLDEVKVLTDANARLQSEIGIVKVDVEQISQLQNQLTELRDTKFELETDYRKLEAEFGPIKFISELIYGDEADTKLDDAVRVVILMLIFVFDPLAVLLLIASNHGYVKRREEENEDTRPENGEETQQVNQSVSTARQGEAVETPPKDDKVVVAEEKVVRVKDADVEVKYDKDKDEFQFVEYPTDVKDDRNFPDLRAKKER